MSWQEILVSVTYTAPSGKSFSFHYENGLQRETDLKTASFTFPKKDGAYIQSLGRGGRRFPFTCTFYGADCVKDADNFENALCETGYGELQYPTGQKYKVVPTGVIKRNDNFVSAANKSTVTVTFAETFTDEKFPADAAESSDAINDAVESFSEAAAKEFADSLSIKNTSELLNAKSVMTEQTRSTSQALEKLTKTGNDIKAIQKSLKDNIAKFSSSIDNIAAKAMTIASQTIKLIRAPSKAAIAVMAKIEGYTSIANSLVRNFTKDPIGLNNLKNQYAATKLQLQSLAVSVASGIAALTNADESAGGFSSREDAVNAALEISALNDTIENYCDTKIESIQNTSESEAGSISSTSVFAETADAYSEMQKVVQLSIAHILNHSFTLKTRRIITLDRDRQMIELLAELYGSIDEHIDEFIRDNNLDINEIALLPAGREIAYYE